MNNKASPYWAWVEKHGGVEPIEAAQNVAEKEEKETFRRQPDLISMLGKLSRREREVVTLLALGCTPSYAAKVLSMRRGAVYAALNRARLKLGDQQ